MIPKLSRVNKIIIHCSASSHEYTLEDMERDHRAKGFMGIGYHYVITDSEIVMTRSVDIAGAHCRSENYDSIGICLIGAGDFTPFQYERLEFLIKKLILIFPKVEIHGHRFYNRRKECPLFDVETWKKGVGL
jgi:N-acetylmuramoyl-L-alanine amidase